MDCVLIYSESIQGQFLVKRFHKSVELAIVSQKHFPILAMYCYSHYFLQLQNFNCSHCFWHSLIVTIVSEFRETSDIDHSPLQLLKSRFHPRFVFIASALSTDRRRNRLRQQYLWFTDLLRCVTRESLFPCFLHTIWWIVSLWKPHWFSLCRAGNIFSYS